MSLVLDGYLVLQFRKCWGTEMALTELCAIYLFLQLDEKKKNFQENQQLLNLTEDFMQFCSVYVFARHSLACCPTTPTSLIGFKLVSRTRVTET